MRDPNRIDPFLEKLGELWKTVPNWRFGQLIMNLCRDGKGFFEDSWGWENDEWEKRIEEWGKKDKHEPTDEEIEARVQTILNLLTKGK